MLPPFVTVIERLWCISWLTRYFCRLMFLPSCCGFFQSLASFTTYRNWMQQYAVSRETHHEDIYCGNLWSYMIQRLVWKKLRENCRIHCGQLNVRYTTCRTKLWRLSLTSYMKSFRKEIISFLFLSLFPSLMHFILLITYTPPRLEPVSLRSYIP